MIDTVKFEKSICKLLNIKPDHTRKVTLEITAGNLPIVKIEKVVAGDLNSHEIGRCIEYIPSWTEKIEVYSYLMAFTAWLTGLDEKTEIGDAARMAELVAYFINNNLLDKSSDEKYQADLEKIVYPVMK